MPTPMQELHLARTTSAPLSQRAVREALPMDVVAWATWLRWGARGDARSMNHLRQELARRGIWSAALQGSCGTDEAAEAGHPMTGWSAYETALAAAAVALLCSDKEAGDTRRLWSRTMLQRAQRLADLAPVQTLTPDGAPMVLACRLVHASTLLHPKAAAEEQLQGLRLLQTVVDAADFGTLPQAWQQAVWACAADHHGRLGHHQVARHFLLLLSAQNRAVEGLFARLRLGGSQISGGPAPLAVSGLGV